MVPSVTSISPTQGSVDGGTEVIITGQNLDGVKTVKFGTQASAFVTQLSSTQVKAISPANVSGQVDVIVTTKNGTTAAVAGDKFTYQAVSPLAPVITQIFPNVGWANIGGVSVITGKNMRAAQRVTFGTTSANFVQWGTTIIVLSPELPRGTYPVTVKTAFGTSAPSIRATYKYVG